MELLTMEESTPRLIPFLKYTIQKTLSIEIMKIWKIF
jgi:hypothetical protein